VGDQLFRVRPTARWPRAKLVQTTNLCFWPGNCISVSNENRVTLLIQQHFGPRISMFDHPTSLRHPEMPKADDADLALESRSHVANTPALQLIAELILKLRAARFPWWTPDVLRDTWDATQRMVWFRQRPDIRQRITHGLTGLAPKAARNKQPDFQAALI